MSMDLVTPDGWIHAPEAYPSTVKMDIFSTSIVEWLCLELHGEQPLVSAPQTKRP